jgi:peptide deformylase
LLREIVMLGEPVLRAKAKPVKAVDAATRRLIDDLVQTMDQADGLGLAAPQIGVGKRVVVCRDEDRVLALVNPRIEARRGRETGVEGCLSMPGLQGNVPRAKVVTVSGLDRAGRTVSYEADGLLARVFQHEIDHLNGALFIDHTRDLWWLERVGDEDDDEEEADDEHVQLQRVPTTLREVESWFAELRAEQSADQVPA